MVYKKESQKIASGYNAIGGFLMFRISYSAEEISLIISCPCVKSVTKKMVRYTAEFMAIFEEETLSGKHRGAEPIGVIQ